MNYPPETPSINTTKNFRIQLYMGDRGIVEVRPGVVVKGDKTLVYPGFYVKRGRNILFKPDKVHIFEYYAFEPELWDKKPDDIKEIETENGLMQIYSQKDYYADGEITAKINTEITPHDIQEVIVENLEIDCKPIREKELYACKARIKFKSKKNVDELMWDSDPRKYRRLSETELEINLGELKTNDPEYDAMRKVNRILVNALTLEEERKIAREKVVLTAEEAALELREEGDSGLAKLLEDAVTPKSSLFPTARYTEEGYENVYDELTLFSGIYKKKI